jgi:hypothetical protein
MIPLTLAAALTTPPAHVVAYDQSAPQATMIWGAAPGIFWTTTDEGAGNAQSSDQAQSSNADPQESRQPQLIPFGLTTL